MSVRTDKLRDRELPSEEHQHDDAEFENQIRRCHLERYGGGEVGALGSATDLASPAESAPRRRHRPAQPGSSSASRQPHQDEWWQNKLNAESRILLIVEPTRGVDVGAKR